ncbi:hypothetical protein HYX16_00010 [Candidatus Woesearchaeota archaeon]|nr:hypothetical protein [Candidatus Woesearchaeota archaeon]
MKKTGKKEVSEKDKYFLDFNQEFNLKTSIFHDFNLTIFEALVKYLKEEKNFNFHEISLILNRDERNIWTVYKNSLKKSNKNTGNDKNLGSYEK